MAAPVVLFVYNRPDHTRQTIEALFSNTYPEPTDLYIFADAARDATEEQNVREVRAYLESVVDRSPMFHVHLDLAEENRGLERNIIGGVTHIVNEYGRVIVLEDDIVTAPDFLQFMNQALDAYEKDANVWSISSYSIESPRIQQCHEDVLWTYRGECWGWASWADRWNKVDWDVCDYKAFQQDRSAQRRFNRAGRDMTSLLAKQQAGEIHSWAIRWCYQEFKEGQITVFPKYPKSYNNGLDGSGTNCGSEESRQVAFHVEDHWDFHYNLQNRTLVHAFQRMYSRAYWWQEFGAIWYSLTEYEHCIGYRSGDQDYRLMRPEGRIWYEDPMPVIYKDQQYVLVAIHNRFSGKSSIGLSRWNECGELDRPVTILQESFSLSFPGTVNYGGETYLIPDCHEAGQIRIYRMNGDPSDWQLYRNVDIETDYIDPIAYTDNTGRLFLICGERNPQNEHQTRLVQYELTGLGDGEPLCMTRCWQQENYSYAAGNAGQFIMENEHQYRIARIQTKDLDAKAVCIHEIRRLDEHGIQETFVSRITPTSVGISFPQYVYRPWGIHTYGRSGDLEVADLLVQRFSLAGLLCKVWRIFHHND